MSRIGQMPVEIPSGVEVTLEGSFIRVKGPKGTLERSLPREMTVNHERDRIAVIRPSDSGQHRSLHGLTRTLIYNMVKGVTEGFEKTLEIHGVGYRANPKGAGIELQLGYSHPIAYDPPEGITLEVADGVTAEPGRTDRVTKVIVRGADKEMVGQVAAEIRTMRPPDPYKQKGVRYEGERIRKKAGKAAIK